MTQRPLILGHRGASALAPENTLTAFKRAIDDGADGIEFDVQLSKDGVVVVIHDATLERTAGLRRRVREVPASELQQTDVSSWFSRREKTFAGETIPTFDQVIDLFKSNAGWLYPEMKCEPKDAVELAARVVELVRASGFSERIIVESFDHSAIAKVKRLDPSIRTAALFEPKLRQPSSAIARPSLIDKALAVNANEVALHYLLAKPRVIEKALSKGLDAVVWTVDDLRWVKRAKGLGVKALISNNPRRMIEHRKQLG